MNVPMEITTDITVNLDQRVIGGWSEKKVEQFFHIVSYQHGAFETMDFYPTDISVTFKGTSAAVARSKITAALKELNT